MAAEIEELEIQRGSVSSAKKTKKKKMRFYRS